MKSFILSISLILSLLIQAFDVKAPSKEIIFFTGTFAEAKALAKKQKKLIFFDAYASWCGPCKMMKGQTFKNETVADYYNENFINIAMDMEKGEGPELQKLYGVKAYPTLMYINAQGNVLYTALGFKNADEFVTIGKTVLEKYPIAKKKKKGKKQ